MPSQEEKQGKERELAVQPTCKEIAELWDRITILHFPGHAWTILILLEDSASWFLKGIQPQTITSV